MYIFFSKRLVLNQIERILNATYVREWRKKLLEHILSQQGKEYNTNQKLTTVLLPDVNYTSIVQ